MNRLKDSKTITAAAMLTAIGIILGFFKLPVNQLIEIRFGTLPVCLAGMFYGPAVGAVVGALTDIGGYLVKPTGPFFPGFTVSGIIGGIIFGLMLYDKRITFARVLVTQIVYTIVVGIIMNSYWLSVLYMKDGYLAALIMRLPKELVMIPVNTAMVFVLLKSTERAAIMQQ